MNIKIQTSKDPGHEGPALDYPWKGVVYIAIFLREYWSAGVVACPGATCRGTLWDKTYIRTG